MIMPGKIFAEIKLLFINNSILSQIRKIYSSIFSRNRMLHFNISIIFMITSIAKKIIFIVVSETLQLN